MLYVNYRINVDGIEQERTLEWLASEPSPKDKVDDENITILDVYADGYELERIMDTFRNIPTVLGRSGVTWRGSVAQFIFDNL